MDRIKVQSLRSGRIYQVPAAYEKYPEQMQALLDRADAMAVEASAQRFTYSADHPRKADGGPDIRKATDGEFVDGRYRYYREVEGVVYPLSFKEKPTEAQIATTLARLSKSHAKPASNAPGLRPMGAKAKGDVPISPQRTERAERVVEAAEQLIPDYDVKGVSQWMRNRTDKEGRLQLTEAEARWAELEYWKRRKKSFGAVLGQVLADPAAMHPAVDLTVKQAAQHPIVSAANVLSTPQRAAATQVSLLLNNLLFSDQSDWRNEPNRSDPRFFGDKYGGLSYAEIYADDPEWGAVMEHAGPDLPEGLRRALAVPADILIDPLIGAGAVSRSTGLPSAISKTLGIDAEKASAGAKLPGKAAADASKEVFEGMSKGQRAADALIQFGFDPQTYLKAPGLILNAALDPIGFWRAAREAVAEGGEATALATLAKVAEANRLRRYASQLGGTPEALERARELMKVEATGKAYPGLLGVQPDLRRKHWLTPDERRIEAEFAAQLQDIDEAVHAYLREHGKVIDVDKVRELYAPYREPGLHRLEMTEALQEPASALSAHIYRQLLEMPQNKGKPVVLLGGGPASGKSSGLTGLEKTIEDAAVVFDASLSWHPGAKKRIALALRSGHPVRIRYVYTDPETAARRMVMRGVKDGRFVSENAVVEMTRGAYQTVRKLLGEFADNPNVVIEGSINGEVKSGDELSHWFKTAALGRDNIRDQVRRGIIHAEREFKEAGDEAATQAVERYHVRSAERLRRAAQPGVLERSGTGEVGSAAVEEGARLAARGSRTPGFWDRLVSQWKANKTVYNPPSTIRNFYQNFILRYLSGEDLTGVPQAALKLMRDTDLRRRLMAEGRVAGDRASDIGETFLKKLDEKAVEVYSDADRLAAAIMSEATGKPPKRFMFDYSDTPRTIDFLAQSGLIPFVRWPYFAVPTTVRGALERPERLSRLLRLITSSKDENDPTRGEYLGVPGQQEMHVRNILPVDPGDFTFGERGLFDPTVMPILQLGGEVREGRRRGESVPRTVAEWLLPPAATYYAKELVAPSEPNPRGRAPRTRAQLVAGLLGFPVRPEDPAFEYRKIVDRERRELREKAKEIVD